MENNDTNIRLLEGIEPEPKLQRKILDEMKTLWVVAGPAIIARFSTLGVTVISQAFIGHIGATELAGYGIFDTVLLRFTVGILLGMASALETLCGQAYGAKQWHMLGIYLQRSWVVLTICSFILIPLFIFSSPLLKLLGQEEDIANMVGYISLWLIPVAFAFLLSFTCQTYLQAQSKNRIIAYLAAAALIIHLFNSWLLTVKYKWGVAGVMISTILAYWIPNVGQFIFIVGGWCPDTWKGFSWLAFTDLWPVIKLSLSSGTMICLEIWYNSILVLLIGNMENAETDVDALSICLNINGLEMMISLGFLAAVGVRVSNELGRGSSKPAKFSVTVTLFTSLTIGFLVFVLFLFLRGRLVYLFTNSEEVAKVVSRLSPLLGCSILLNSVQPVLVGVAIGAGWQGVVGYVNLACYYLIGLPLGIMLGYYWHFQVRGIWMGMLFGVVVQTVVLLTIVLTTDWDKQVALAQLRVQKWFIPESGETRLN